MPELRIGERECLWSCEEVEFRRELTESALCMEVESLVLPGREVWLRNRWSSSNSLCVGVGVCVCVYGGGGWECVMWLQLEWVKGVSCT